MDETDTYVHEKLYRGLIGSLLYVTTSTPDIVFSVGLCARFQANPKESHIKSVKEFSGISKELQIRDSGIQKKAISIWLVMQMSIMLDTWLTEKSSQIWLISLEHV